MIKPLNNRVVIKPDEVKTETASGIILPDEVANKEKPVIGTVVVGNDLVKEGDRVVFSKFGMDEVTDDGIMYYVVSSSCVLAILNNE